MLQFDKLPNQMKGILFIIAALACLAGACYALFG